MSAKASLSRLARVGRKGSSASLSMTGISPPGRQRLVERIYRPSCRQHVEPASLWPNAVIVALAPARRSAPGIPVLYSIDTPTGSRRPEPLSVVQQQHRATEDDHVRGVLGGHERAVRTAPPAAV